MAARDLFELARSNDDSLGRALMGLTAESTEDATQVARFAAFVKDGARMSANMRPNRLRDFLKSGRLSNVFSWAQEEAARTGRDADAVLRASQGDWYARRVGFSDAFAGGRAFFYAALNVGGVGASKYGEYCVFGLADFADDANAVALLKRDSLSGYTEPDGRVRLDKLAADVGTWSSRGCIAALKHAGDRLDEERAWPAMLCSAEAYVEVIVGKEFTPSALDGARMSSSDHAEIEELVFRSKTEELEESDLLLLEAHEWIGQWFRDRVMQLEVVPC